MFYVLGLRQYTKVSSIQETTENMVNDTSLAKIF